jgi:hypothetical protein
VGELVKMSPIKISVDKELGLLNLISKKLYVIQKSDNMIYLNVCLNGENTKDGVLTLAVTDKVLDMVKILRTLYWYKVFENKNEIMDKVISP